MRGNRCTVLKYLIKTGRGGYRGGGLSNQKYFTSFGRTPSNPHPNPTSPPHLTLTPTPTSHPDTHIHIHTSLAVFRKDFAHFGADKFGWICSDLVRLIGNSEHSQPILTKSETVGIQRKEWDKKKRSLYKRNNRGDRIT